MLFSTRPGLSILLFTSWPLSTPVRPSLVNCAPWSVLKSAGLPCRFIETVDAESGVQCVANPKTRHLATVPINYRHQIAETLFQPDVRDIDDLLALYVVTRCRYPGQLTLPRYRQRGTTLHRQQPLTYIQPGLFFSQSNSIFS